METAIECWDYIGVVEKRMETTIESESESGRGGSKSEFGRGGGATARATASPSSTP